MQKLILSVLLTSLLFTISKAQNSKEKIGISKNGKLVITSSLKKIKNEWAEILKDQQIVVDLIDYSIVKGIDSGSNNRIYYMLLGKNVVSTVKVATKLRLLNKTFYLPNYKKTDNLTVTCSGTKYLCNPQIFEGNWICGKNCSIECKKSVTVKE